MLCHSVRMAFHGRDEELAALLAAVSEHRLVTLTGPIGVGKSRLVAEALDALRTDFAEVVAHRLDPVPSSADAGTIAGHLGSASANGLALELAAGSGLLVLDNCDHLLAGTGDLVRQLLDANDTLVVLVTAREPLHLPEELVQVLAPLPVPDIADPDPGGAAAVEMFLDRSRAVGARWPDDLTTVQAVADLCRELDGLPLAIELAAARSRALSPTDLRAALRQRLDLLDSRNDAGGLRAALADALAQLNEGERSLLRRVAVLPDAFDVDLAHAIAGVGDDVLGTVDALDVLVERSLLQVETRASRSRYRLLAVVRDVALSDLEDAGEVAAAHDRYADVMAGIADDLVAAGLRRWSGEVVGGIAMRITLLLSAAEWCVRNDETPDRAFRLYLPLFAGVHQNRSAEVRRAGEQIFDRWPDSPAPLRAECLGVVATGAAIGGDLATARELAGRALADPEITGVGTVVAQRALVLAALATKDFAAAIVHARAGQAAANTTGMYPFALELRTFVASAEDLMGLSAEGLRHAVDVAVDAEQSDDAVTELWARVVAANIAARAGDWAEVREQTETARIASAAAATEGWTARVFRSDALLAGYAATATAHLHGWADSVPEWQHAVRVAAAGGGVPEIATTVRAAAAVARRLGQDRTADALAAAVPASSELVVLPEVFPTDDIRAGRLAVGLSVAYHAALDALHPADALRSLRAVDVVHDQSGLLRRDGDVWEIAYAGATARIRHLKGIADLAVLLARPDQEVHTLELMGVVDIGDAAGPAIDDQARNSYRTRVLDLQEEIDDAREANDLGRAERAEDELDALVAELSASLGLGGRGRQSGSTVERARSAVTFRLRSAIKRISEQHDALGRHLRNSVRTGTWCAYLPEQPVRWEVDPG